MSNKKVTILAVAVGMAVLVTEICSAGVGTTGAQFLKIGPGARAVSMGGAFSAVADDLNSIYWNPAGLAGQKSRQATASYIQYFQGTNIGFLGYSQKVRQHGAFGVGLDYLTIGEIERRSTDVDTSEGTFGASDMALYLSYANDTLMSQYIKGVKLGTNIKIIRQTIDTQTAQSFALDIGALYATPVKNLTAGLGIYNLGGQVKFIDEGDPLPLDVRVGGAYRCLNNKLLFAVDIDDYINDGRLTEAIGAEYTFKKMLSIRAGYKLGMDSNALGGLAGFAAGLGINVWNIQMDYAFVPYGELNDTHRISMSTKF